jgi:hypothetical protein
MLLAGAAAQVSFQPSTDLRLRALRVAQQQPIDEKDHPGRALPALQVTVLPETLLRRVELLARTQALNCRYLSALRLDRQDHARLDGVAYSMTVQAQRMMVSQPTWVPVKPARSRR